MALNCTRMLHALSTHPPPAVMNVDLASCLSLRQPLHPLLTPLRSATRRLSSSASPTSPTSYTLRHPSTPTSPSSPVSPASPSESRGCLRRDHWGLKKHVSFADAKGLALTAVRLFIPEAASLDSLPSMVMRRSQTKQEGVSAARKSPYKLRLAFTQPSLDFKVFASRQKEVGLQLESCTVSEYCLSGRVRVLPMGSEQAVHVRMSFDSWRSHHDIPCTFLYKQRLGTMDTDIYAFELSLPMNLEPIYGIEFGVSLKTNEGALWDDNRGQHYKIQVEKDGVEQVATAQGSPRLSRYLSPPTHKDGVEQAEGSPRLSRYLSPPTHKDVVEQVVTAQGSPRLSRYLSPPTHKDVVEQAGAAQGSPRLSRYLSPPTHKDGVEQVGTPQGSPRLSRYLSPPTHKDVVEQAGAAQGSPRLSRYLSPPTHKDGVEQAGAAQGSPRLSRYQSPPTASRSMTPVDVKSYSELPHLRALWSSTAEWGLCAVK